MTQASVNVAPTSAPMDKDKRNWLIGTAVVGGAGVAAVAVPFVSTFTPSERAKAAGASVEVDISGIKPGEKIKFMVINEGGKMIVTDIQLVQ